MRLLLHARLHLLIFPQLPAVASDSLICWWWCLFCIHRLRIFFIFISFSRIRVEKVIYRKGREGKYAKIFFSLFLLPLIACAFLFLQVISFDVNIVSSSHHSEMPEWGYFAAPNGMRILNWKSLDGMASFTQIIALEIDRISEWRLLWVCVEHMTAVKSLFVC